MKKCPDKFVNRTDSTQEMIAEIERLRDALREARDTFNKTKRLRLADDMVSSAQEGAERVNAALGDRHE